MFEVRYEKLIEIEKELINKTKMIRKRHIEFPNKIIVFITDIDNKIIYSVVTFESILIEARAKAENIDEEYEINSWKIEHLRDSCECIGKDEPQMDLPL